MKINILADEVIGKIAAGEVVERPSSVVKELVENSIDADSSSIEIEIESAGQTLIRIADNGVGMTAEDAKIAPYPHATSKISDIRDLDKIGTLGFRGEALSSIAAVSQMELTTKTQEGESGVYLYVEDCQIRQFRPAGRSQGTTIEVRNLFYNVPARKKFLKRTSTELAEIVNVVGRFILAYPNIEFKLIHGKKCLIHSPKGDELRERARIVLGGDVADNFLEVSSSQGKYKITGFVSRPSSTRKDRRAQLFFVNGRYVRNRSLNDAVYGAYRSLLERGRFPSVVLFLTVPSEDVDVNVHPAKLEVKFDDEQAVKNAVIGAIKSRFDEAREENAEAFENMPGQVSAETGDPANRAFSGVSEAQTEFARDFYEGTVTAGYFPKKPVAFISGEQKVSGEARNVFQTGRCYIVQINNASIKITDQHAAHERILYEIFSKSAEGSSPEVQNLLFPVRIDLSASGSILMERVVEIFNTLGFQVEPFGEKSFAVQAVPAVLKERDIKTVLYDVLTDLGSIDLARIDLIDELVKLTACRAAIKAGDVLTEEEMVSLLEQLAKCDLPFTCPHGRPTVIDITTNELEKRFRRK